MRERGLKLMYLLRKWLKLIVAPHAGAWIETIQDLKDIFYNSSLPMRERGLKPQVPPLTL